MRQSHKRRLRRYFSIIKQIRLYLIILLLQLRSNTKLELQKESEISKEEMLAENHDHENERDTRKKPIPKKSIISDSVNADKVKQFDNTARKLHNENDTNLYSQTLPDLRLLDYSITKTHLLASKYSHNCFSINQDHNISTDMTEPKDVMSEKVIEDTIEEPQDSISEETKENESEQKVEDKSDEEAVDEENITEQDEGEISEYVSNIITLLNNNRPAVYQDYTDQDVPKIEKDYEEVIDLDDSVYNVLDEIILVKKRDNGEERETAGGNTCPNPFFFEKTKDVKGTHKTEEQELVVSTIPAKIYQDTGVINVYKPREITDQNAKSTVLLHLPKPSTTSKPITITITYSDISVRGKIFTVINMEQFWQQQLESVKMLWQGVLYPRTLPAGVNKQPLAVGTHKKDFKISIPTNPQHQDIPSYLLSARFDNVKAKENFWTPIYSQQSNDPEISSINSAAGLKETTSLKIYNFYAEYTDHPEQSFNILCVKWPGFIDCNILPRNLSSQTHSTHFASPPIATLLMQCVFDPAKLDQSISVADYFRNNCKILDYKMYGSLTNVANDFNLAYEIISNGHVSSKYLNSDTTHLSDHKCLQLKLFADLFLNDKDIYYSIKITNPFMQFFNALTSIPSGYYKVIKLFSLYKGLDLLCDDEFLQKYLKENKYLNNQNITDICVNFDYDIYIDTISQFNEYIKCDVE